MSFLSSSGRLSLDKVCSDGNLGYNSSGSTSSISSFSTYSGSSLPTIIDICESFDELCIGNKRLGYLESQFGNKRKISCPHVAENYANYADQFSAEEHLVILCGIKLLSEQSTNPAKDLDVFANYFFNLSFKILTTMPLDSFLRLTSEPSFVTDLNAPSNKSDKDRFISSMLKVSQEHVSQGRVVREQLPDTPEPTLDRTALFGLFGYWFSKCIAFEPAVHEQMCRTFTVWVHSRWVAAEEIVTIGAMLTRLLYCRADTFESEKWLYAWLQQPESTCFWYPKLTENTFDNLLGVTRVIVTKSNQYFSEGDCNWFSKVTPVHYPALQCSFKLEGTQRQLPKLMSVVEALLRASALCVTDRLILCDLLSSRFSTQEFFVDDVLCLLQSLKNIPVSSENENTMMKKLYERICTCSWKISLKAESECLDLSAYECQSLVYPDWKENVCLNLINAYLALFNSIAAPTEQARLMSVQLTIARKNLINERICTLYECLPDSSRSICSERHKEYNFRRKNIQ